MCVCVCVCVVSIARTSFEDVVSQVQQGFNVLGPPEGRDHFENLVV